MNFPNRIIYGSSHTCKKILCVLTVEVLVFIIFLADSFKYNRINDVGYLVARIFVNKDNNFIVEGKQKLGILFNDFARQKIDTKLIKKVIESALKYSIELDLIVPPFNSVRQVSVLEMQNLTSSMSLKTGKKLGFKYKASENKIK